VVYLTRQLAAELGPYGIRANSISPGQTPTALRKFSDPVGGENLPSAGRADRTTQTRRIPLGRRGTLDDYVGANPVPDFWPVGLRDRHRYACRRRGRHRALIWRLNE